MPLTNTTPLVLGQLKAWPALTGHSTFRCLSADMSAAMLFIHAAQAFCEKEEQLACL